MLLALLSMEGGEELIRERLSNDLQNMDEFDEYIAQNVSSVMQNIIKYNTGVVVNMTKNNEDVSLSRALKAHKNRVLKEVYKTYSKIIKDLEKLQITIQR